MNPAAIAWLLIAIFVNVGWISYDVWAKLTNHWTMTRQMHDWLFNSSVGPFFYAGWVFVFVLALTHFFMYHAAR
jgi:TRAP-type C4-dicarboxylate transport system permease small subunit